jgi:heme-degrading monooxygenase HmoA
MLLVCRLDWHVSPLRGHRWLDVWEPAAAKCSAYGAKSWSLTRGDEDPLGFQLTTVWESKADFERFWYSQEVAEAREATIGWYNIPILPTWHTLIAAESIVASGA